MANFFVILCVPGRAACAYVYEDVVSILAILCTAPYFLFFCRSVTGLCFFGLSLRHRHLYRESFRAYPRHMNIMRTCGASCVGGALRLGPATIFLVKTNKPNISIPIVLQRLQDRGSVRRDDLQDDTN